MDNTSAHGGHWKKTLRLGVRIGLKWGALLALWYGLCVLVVVAIVWVERTMLFWYALYALIIILCLAILPSMCIGAITGASVAWAMKYQRRPLTHSRAALLGILVATGCSTFGILLLTWYSGGTLWTDFWHEDAIVGYFLAPMTIYMIASSALSAKLSRIIGNEEPA